jgi:hypothetical protein
VARRVLGNAGVICTYVILDRRLDEAAAGRLLVLAEQAIASGARALGVSLAGVLALGVAAVAALGRLVRGAPREARVVLAALDRPVRAIAQATCLHELVDIFTTVEGAVRELAA